MLYKSSQWYSGHHDDVIRLKHFPRYWPFVRGIHRLHGEFPSQRPVTRSFDFFFDPRLSKQSWGWWFGTPSSSLWRHRNGLSSLSINQKIPFFSLSLYIYIYAWHQNSETTTYVTSQWDVLWSIYVSQYTAVTQSSDFQHDTNCIAWWRHQMETFSALLAICAENSPVPGEFPTQRPVTRSFDVFFDLRLNKRLSKQWWGLWFETLTRLLWRHRNGMKIM